MRFLGVILLVLGCGVTAYAVRELDRRSRPADVAFAVIAPIAALVGLLGLALTFVPDFL